MFRRFLPLVLVLAPSLARAGEPVSFQRDVMAILSKSGCNAGTCHGNFNGKNGFRLSLRGQDPAFDFAALTRDQLGRRVDRQRPEASLILQKPTGGLPHEGGNRFTANSQEYRLLLRWVTEGLHNDAGQVTPLARLDVEPREQIVVGQGQSVRLKVNAHFADGASGDVTRLATFEPVHQDVAINREGEARRTGASKDNLVEASVLVRYLNKQVVVRLTFIDARAEVKLPHPANYVDEHVYARLDELGVEPSAVCGDQVFLRRAYLDLLGSLPTVAEARSFLADQRIDKRKRLVDQLLERSEFADFWAMKWGDLLRNEEKSLDPKGVRAFHAYLRQSIVNNKPLNELAREIVGARGSSYSQPAVNFYRVLRDNQSRTEAVAQVFLGVRLQCAKCHNHPFDQWTQDDYYGMSAFFARIQYQIVENNRKDRFDLHEFDGEQIVWLGRRGEVKHPRTAEPVTPAVFGSKPATRDDDRLQALADWVASPDNPFFARAQANRIWYHLLGRGIVDPIDDFRLTNLPSNPPLLDALTRDLVASGFDLKHLIRIIMASRTYQVAAQPTPTNATDETHFARGQVRRLQAEQLLDAMSQALEVPLKLRGYPAGTRASQIAGAIAPPRRTRRDATMGGANEVEVETFLRTFGKPDRLLTCECERSDEPTVIQAFRFIAGDPANEMLSTQGNRLGRLLAAKKTDDEMIEELYLATLSRFPKAEERSALTAYIARAGDRRAALEDVAWGLLNAKEFLLRQ